MHITTFMLYIRVIDWLHLVLCYHTKLNITDCKMVNFDLILIKSILRLLWTLTIPNHLNHSQDYAVKMFRTGIYKSNQGVILKTETE